MAKVFRVEYSDGIGPYSSRAIHGQEARELERDLHKAHGNEDHPSAVHDCTIKGSWNIDLLCGFDTLRQYKDWFEKEFRERLSKAGAFLSYYKVPRGYCFRGGSQIVFCKSQSKLIARYDPDIDNDADLNDLIVRLEV